MHLISSLHHIYGVPEVSTPYKGIVFIYSNSATDMLVFLCTISTHGTSFRCPVTVSLLHFVLKFIHVKIPLN